MILPSNMKSSDFSNTIKKTITLLLMGYFSVISPVMALAQTTEPVSAPVTIPVVIPVPTATPSATPTVTPSPTPRAITPCDADVNKDGNVNISDFSLIKYCLGKTPTGFCLNADVNKDRRIDEADIQGWQKNTGSQCLENLIPAAPEMVYPQNGQTLDLEGAYMFKVKPVPGASGYLFGFFQNGVMIYENLRDSRRLSPNGELAILENNPAHAKFHAGSVVVTVRTYVRNRWSDARTITITLKPRIVKPQIITTWPTNLIEGRFFILSGTNFGNSGKLKLYKSGIAYNTTVYYWSNNMILAQIPANFSIYRTYSIGIQVSTSDNRESPIIYRYISK